MTLILTDSDFASLLWHHLATDDATYSYASN